MIIDQSFSFQWSVTYTQPSAQRSTLYMTFCLLLKNSNVTFTHINVYRCIDDDDDDDDENHFQRFCVFFSPLDLNCHSFVHGERNDVFENFRWQSTYIFRIDCANVAH